MGPDYFTEKEDIHAQCQYTRASMVEHGTDLNTRGKNMASALDKCANRW